MRIRYILATGLLSFSTLALAQEVDSVKSISLSEIVVSESFYRSRNSNSAIHIDILQDSLLRKNFTGNFVQSLSQIPGVHSMDIGSGFSKPMIRGMAFNRISVLENGVKQEGQQWGTDHGLEIDAFNVESVSIRKGPSALLYGSDAMGGTIEISQLAPKGKEHVFGEVSILGKSVNEALAGSLLLGIKKDSWFAKARYSQQNFGDYRVPTDSIVYLDYNIPIYGQKLKNTAGVEHNINLFGGYQHKQYKLTYTLSNVYQKTGFFPGSHGIPDIERVQDDGDSRNIDLPFSNVNHLKILTHQQYMFDKWILDWNLGYQNNHREEWSSFHSHYGSQQPPTTEPDKELEFDKDTYSSSIKVKYFHSNEWGFSLSWDIQSQNNDVYGYSFLLPNYDQFTTGTAFITNYRPSHALLFTGGLRFDYGKIDIYEFVDVHLEQYLTEQGYEQEIVNEYKYRSQNAKRQFGDWSASIGMTWSPNKKHLIQSNVGHSFRLPSANELTSNGIHHGAFRYERGDINLDSEKGWQLDASYLYESKNITVSISPFASWFSNYIFLKPTGIPSILPHSGQIYQYTGAEALFAGAEASISIDIFPFLKYQIDGSYVHTYNMDENRPLSFSPPAVLNNTITWHKKGYSTYVQLRSAAKQDRVSQTEEKTDGRNTLNMGAMADIKMGGINIELTLLAQNILDAKYYNHLSFYRKVEIPEAGRNFQLLIKIPFKNLLK